MKKCTRCTWRYDCEHADNPLWEKLAGPQNPDHAGVAEEKPASVPRYNQKVTAIYKAPPKAFIVEDTP